LPPHRPIAHRAIAGALAFVALVALGLGWIAARSAGDPHVPADRTASARDPGREPTTTVGRDPGPPYAVGVTHVQVVDRSRPLPARGSTPPADERVLNVTIRYPIAGVASGAEVVDAHASGGRRVLVLFAHGLALTDQTYPRFLHDLAAAGFVVADPEFPLSSSALPGPASGADQVNQAADLGFVADQLFDPASRPSMLAGVVLHEKLGVIGHSDGGVTAAGFAANSCCADPRVGAAVILAGAIGRFPGSWYTGAAPPTLAIHGDADEVNPLGSSLGVYASARAPKMLAVVHGGTHIGAFEDDVRRPAVVALVADFLRASVLGDADAVARLPGDAEVPDVLSLLANE
jgi:alpha-beta hydrolase superfamily lysophospholipase